MNRFVFFFVLLCVGGCSPEREPVDLDLYERKGFSQFGEEGVLEQIFEIIPPPISLRGRVRRLRWHRELQYAHAHY